MAQRGAARRRDPAVPGSQTLKAEMGIRDLIHAGRVRPGDRLSEIALSGQLALSRTPVRAALMRLEQEGLLSAIPTGGYAVRSFSAADVADAIELRGVLEGTAARLAAERGISPGQAAVLRDLLSELDAAVGASPDALDFDRYLDRNAAFHAVLADLPGSSLIRREIERAMRLPFASPSAFLRVQVEIPAFRASLALGQSQHRAIVAAVLGREGARAEALAREHARLALHNLDHVIGDRQLRSQVPGLSLVVS